MPDTPHPEALSLPEPVYFRLLLVEKQRSNGAPHVIGFRNRRNAENWIAEKLDFDHFEYTLESLHTADQMRTALAERDAALERAQFCLAMTRNAQAVADRANELMTVVAAERDALRQELEALRSNYAHQSAELITARTARTALLSAREGRQPLTDEQLELEANIAGVHEVAHTGREWRIVREFGRRVERCCGIGSAKGDEA